MPFWLIYQLQKIFVLLRSLKTVLDDVKPTDSPDDDEVPPTVETEPDDKEMEEGGSALYSSVKNENEDDESDEGMSFKKHLFLFFLAF